MALSSTKLDPECRVETALEDLHCSCLHGRHSILWCIGAAIMVKASIASKMRLYKRVIVRVYK